MKCHLSYYEKRQLSAIVERKRPLCFYQYQKLSQNIFRFSRDIVWNRKMNSIPEWMDECIPWFKVHGANEGPIWGRQDPGGPHVGPLNLAIWVSSQIIYWRKAVPLIWKGWSQLAYEYRAKCPWSYDENGIVIWLEPSIKIETCFRDRRSSKGVFGCTGTLCDYFQLQSLHRLYKKMN